jgi:hypothetical protein
MGVAEAFEAANAESAARASELGFSDRIPFLCECEDPGCFALVRLFAVDYRERRAIGDPITLAEHGSHPVNVARRDGSGAFGENKGAP